MTKVLRRDSMKTMVIDTPAKINLFLRVLRRLPDGYHEIDSLIVPVAIFDTVSLELGTTGIFVRCPGYPEIDDRANLAYLAADRHFAEAGLSPNVTILIKKRIPIEAGLGGGSSDAGAVLRALQELSPRPLPPDRLHQVARELGADVAFFLQDHPCRVKGIGERLSPVDNLPRFWAILACAPFRLSTRSVYQSLKFPLTRVLDSDRGEHAGRGFGFEQLASQMLNDLQPTGESLHPEIGRVQKELLRIGAAGASMSGSGPTVFGLFRTRREARGALRRIEPEQGWTYLVARGITARNRARE